MINQIVDEHVVFTTPSGAIVTNDYVSISAVADICKPWIDHWGGDEWGESMSSLHGACHTSYGFSDEDCALFASKLLENLESQKVWMDEEGKDYEYMEPEDLARIREETCRLRDYWLKGGNLGDFGGAPETAKATIDTLPKWLFEDES